MNGRRYKMFWEWIWWQIGAVENEKIVLNEATLEMFYLSWELTFKNKGGLIIYDRSSG